MLFLAELPLDNRGTMTPVCCWTYGWTKRCRLVRCSRRGLCRRQKSLEDTFKIAVGRYSPVAAGLLLSLRKDIKKAPALTERQLAIIGRAVSEGDLKLLERYRDKRKAVVISRIDELLNDVVKKDFASIFRILNEMDAFLSGEPDMISTILTMIGENLDDKQGPDIAAAVICCFGFIHHLTVDARKTAIRGAEV